MNRRLLSWPIAATLCLFGAPTHAQPEDPAAAAENLAGVRAHFAGDLDQALIHLGNAATIAQTPLYRVTASINAVHVLKHLERYNEALAMIDLILADPEAFTLGVSHMMPALYRHHADILQSLGQDQAALDVRAAGIATLEPTLNPLLSKGKKLADLYVDNAVHAAALGDTALAKHWFDRLFAEHPDFGYQGNEKREIYRSRALTESGLDDDSPEFAARARELADMPGLYPGRATPWLLSMVNHHHAMEDNRAEQRAVAAEVYAGSIAHGWHQKHNEYRFPSLLSEAQTERTRHNVASILIMATNMRPQTTEEVDENYLYAVFILQELADIPFTKKFNAGLKRLTRTYELHLGQPGQMDPG